ncbi:MAG: hypothetical protein D6689_17460 [Deltaproteobacteria bacterium]|nr:MAG: hypothetical protein D6689_17460 [Deltaproteobacteria bacterium]
MTRWVVVTDARRARLLRLERDEATEVHRLVELEALVHAGRRQRPSEVFTESRPGLRASDPGAGLHATDDHRERHIEEWDRRFARDVARALAERIRGTGGTVVLAASEHMLGLLREELPRFVDGVDVKEYAVNLAGARPAEIHDALAERGALPPRRRPTS